MDMEMETKKELLDRLMSEMDGYSADQTRNKKPVVVAIKEQEVKVDPNGQGKNAPEMMEEAAKKDMGIDPEKEKKTYLNPGRQNVMDEIDKQSSMADDEKMPRSFKSFIKSRKG